MYKYGMAHVLGMGIPVNRIEGGAWLMLCLQKTGDEDLKKHIEVSLERLNPEERKQAEAAAIEIQKTL